MSEWGDVRDVAMEIAQLLVEEGASGGWLMARGPSLLREGTATVVLIDAAAQCSYRITVEGRES